MLKTHYSQLKHLTLFISELLRQEAILLPINQWEIMQDRTKFEQNLHFYYKR